jgi:antitoxin ParD1/3/4
MSELAMNTPLTPKIEQLIKERLQSGSYNSATEVIEDAFEALTERENFQAVRAELDRADAQIERGEYTEYDENTIRDMADQIKTRGQVRLVEERKSRTR